MEVRCLSGYCTSSKITAAAFEEGKCANCHFRKGSLSFAVGGCVSVAVFWLSKLFS